MSQMEMLQDRITRLERRLTVVYGFGALILFAGLLTATMGMANNQQKGQNIVASRIAIVDTAGREIMTLGSTTDGMAGIWLKRGNGSNPIVLQQTDNTANFHVRNLFLEATESRQVAQFGISSDGRAGLWFKSGNNANNILLQTEDNNAKLWARDYYVKTQNRTLASLGTSNQGNGGVWLYQGDQSKWALAIQP